MPYRRKLIEVALPLEAINLESAREKSIRHGHPSTLHLWWARRPLAACRAVLFSSLVDDPSEYMPDEESARLERERLFKIIEDLVLWENINNEEVLDKAKLEIARSVARDLGVEVPVGKAAIREFLATKAPPVLDPFAGGGSIPLEAQRLGLRAYASDLNPVAVLINKALIEIPPKFAGMPPVHPAGRGEASATVVKSKRKTALADASPQLWKKEWIGAEGLAEDVRYYGKWMRNEAEKRIGHLYPPVKITAELLAERSDLKAQGLKPGDELAVLAWLWARTVKCPNPACGAQMPLAVTFMLADKKGKKTWVEPLIEGKGIRFTVKSSSGTPSVSPKIGRGAQFRCLVCNQVAPESNIRAEFKTKRNGVQMMAIVAEGQNIRCFLSPIPAHDQVARSAIPLWVPDAEMNQDTSNLVSGRGYGITQWQEIFTVRQLSALSTFGKLIQEVRALVIEHARYHNDRVAESYANAIATYLAFALNKGADYWNTIATWMPRGTVGHAFSKQALPMTWDFPEANPFAKFHCAWDETYEWVAKSLETLPSYSPQGTAIQRDAVLPIQVNLPLVSTDPPYYDNIGYADLSDFFYIWLRYALADSYSSLFGTMLVPKASELVASAHRFDGSKQQAEQFFENGLQQVFRNLRQATQPAFPVTVYYAFKQSEKDEDRSDPEQTAFLDARTSTGWETMLTGLIENGFEITGTWPVRTERSARSIGIGTNALASSIVLVCRPRPTEAIIATRKDFLAALKREIPPALRQLQQGSIAPVDLAQAAIGPGMAVFSRYKQVLEADGSPMRVRAALSLINQALDEFLAEQEGEYDGDTRWALAWYEQYGHEQGPYGVAETLSKAKNTSVHGLVEAGILEARAGKVRLLRRDELDPEWDPQKDKRPTAWEACQHLIYDLEKGGEQSAAGLLAKLGSLSETARDLAYRLYTICERKGWAQDALGYNMLVVAWPRLREMARGKVQPEPGRLL